MRIISFLIIFISLNMSVYADDIIYNEDVYAFIDNTVKNVEDSINENIGVNYINWNRSSVACSHPDYDMYLSITIYFSSGTYEMRQYFEDIIENKLIAELVKNTGAVSIRIDTYYPFSIIFVNNNNYDINEKINIINEIHPYQYRIFIENMFQYSIYGYRSGFSFGIFFMNYYQSDDHDIKFDMFLEILNGYFGEESIIEF
jgi:hypothetical protein